jgi:hypothetical protein
MIPTRGDRITTPGSRQVVALPASRKAQPPIQINRWARNPKHPNADLENQKQEALNQIGMFRTKQVFCGMGNITTFGGVNATAWPRWRFAFHTGPLSHALFVRSVQGIPLSVTNAYIQFDLYSDAAETVLVSSTTFNYGPNTNNAGGQLGWQNMRVLDQYIDVVPDTDYYVVVRNAGSARNLSMAVVELASMTENNAGYLAQNITAQGSILDVYREKQAGLIKSLWKRGGSQVLNWTTEPGNLFPAGSGPAPNFDWKVTSSTTPKNILDLTTTSAPSASTPGWTIDMTGKARLMQTTGVPCVIKAFGKFGSGTGGVVTLRDSSNTVLVTLNGAWGTTASWKSTTFNLPASAGKYDIYFNSSTAGTDFSLWAVSIFEYET